MSWPDRLKQSVPRDEIPTFLADLQGLVAALREDREWTDRLSPSILAHHELALDYMQPGAKRDRVAKAIDRLLE